MHAWEAIQESLDYIEQHIKDELSIEELAEVSHLSLFYYQRLFSRLVGKTVKDYIKARRVANAKQELRESSKRILDIALDYGFNSHEAFTKTFKEVYGMTPEAYRKGEDKLHDFLKPNLMIKYTMIDEQVPLMVDDMILEIRGENLQQEVCYTGISKSVDASQMNKVGVNTLVGLWDQFHQIKDTIPGLKKDGIAIDYFTYADEPGNVTYFVGGEAEQDPNGFDQIVMTKGQYYVCAFEAESFAYLVNNALYKANQYFFETWLLQKGIAMEDMEPFLIQRYFPTQHVHKIEIWIKPMKQ